MKNVVPKSFESHKFLHILLQDKCIVSTNPHRMNVVVDVLTKDNVFEMSEYNQKMYKCRVVSFLKYIKKIMIFDFDLVWTHPNELFLHEPPNQTQIYMKIYNRYRDDFEIYYYF